MKSKSLVSAAVLMALLSGCNTDQLSTQSTEKVQATTPLTETDIHINKKAQTLDALYLQASQQLFRARPISAGMYGLDEQLAGQYYTDKIGRYSPAHEHALRSDLRALVEQIKQADTDSVQDLENQRVMSGLVRYFSGHEDFSIGYIDTWMGLSPFIVSQINGPLIDVLDGLQYHPVKNEKHAQEYIQRLTQFAPFVASVSEKLSADVAQDWIAPKVILQGALNFLDNFLKPAPDQHPLITDFTAKVEKLDGLTPAQKSQLIAQATQQVSDVVYPAYHKIQTQVKNLLPKARTESGIWAQPNGDKFYQDAILQLGDSSLTADKIHQIGLDEVKRITDDMDTILRTEGYTSGTVGERMNALNEEPRFLYDDTDEGRAQLLADLNGYIDEIGAKMPALFKTKPAYKVEVKAFPVETQDGAPGGEYSAPSLDGSKPGTYWINLRDMKANPKFGLKTLTYHEANPGHHWQGALNLEQDSLPFLRRIAPYNAYAEGWALYSELVAYEMGMYENDPFGNLGRLQGEIFRAVRLVVDTGIHHKRWTREQAIDYMAKATGSALSDVTAEIERYMAWPGQALGYKMGMLKILELRQSAQTQLGDKFDMAEFHDLVLLGGAVPMEVLEQKVNHWVKAQQ